MAASLSRLILPTKLQRRPGAADEAGQAGDVRTDGTGTEGLGEGGRYVGRFPVKARLGTARVCAPSKDCWTAVRQRRFLEETLCCTSMIMSPNRPLSRILCLRDSFFGLEL